MTRRCRNRPEHIPEIWDPRGCVPMILAILDGRGGVCAGACTHMVPGMRSRREGNAEAAGNLRRTFDKIAKRLVTFAINCKPVCL